MHSRLLLFLFALLVFSVPGCGVDYETIVDAKVTKEWMRPGMYVDAIEYFESGGRYYSGVEMEGKPDLDREAILPFLKELKEEFGQEQYVILVEADEEEVANPDGPPRVDEYAWGIVMKLPVNPDNRRRFEDHLEKAEETFPGMIIQQWGHEWISFDFLDQEEADFIREAEAAAKANS